MVEGRGYCCIGLLPFLVAILAIAASAISTGWCETVKFSPHLDQLPNNNVMTTNMTQDVLSNSDGFAKLQFGLYYFKKVEDVDFDSSYVDVKDSCVEYSSSVDMDASWKVARAFAVAVPILGGLMALALLVSPCIIFFSKATWTKLAVAFMTLVAGMQGLTLLVLMSDLCKSNPIIEDRFQQVLDVFNGEPDTTTTTNTSTTTTITTAGDSNVNQEVLDSIYDRECEWDWGIYAQIASMILFFLTGVVMLVMGAPVRPEQKEPDEQVVTYEQKTDEQGETRVEEVQVDTYTAQSANSELPPWAKTNKNSNGNQLEQAQLY